MHGDVQHSPEFRIGPAVSGFTKQALDGGRQGTVAGELHVANAEQAEAVEAGRVAVGVEAAVVVVAAQVTHLAEVAEGSGTGGLAEGVLELIEGDGGASRQQRDQQVGGASGHNELVYIMIAHDIYTISNLCREIGTSGQQSARIAWNQRIRARKLTQYAKPNCVKVQLYQCLSNQQPNSDAVVYRPS